MATREDLYKYFGTKLLESVVIVVLSEINILRNEAGLPERSIDQMVNALESEVTNLTDYEWMND